MRGVGSTRRVGSGSGEFVSKCVFIGEEAAVPAYPTQGYLNSTRPSFDAMEARTFARNTCVIRKDWQRSLMPETDCWRKEIR